MRVRWRWRMLAGVVLLFVMMPVVGCTRDPPTDPVDYTDPANWLALLDRDDEADAVPDAGDLTGSLGGLLGDRQATARVDAFYVHPTTLIDTLLIRNAALDEDGPNAEAQEAVRLQASVLNGAARVFAPRYRQASLVSYDPDVGGDRGVLGAAEADVRRAFRHWDRTWSDGRPFIVFGHSQGASHLVRLLQRIEGTEVAGRLVAAYLVGERVGPDTFDGLEPCRRPRDVGCVMSWVSVAPGADPTLACGAPGACGGPVNTRAERTWCTNPITGTNRGASSAEQHLGAGPGDGLGGSSFTGFRTNLVTAHCDESGLLRVADTPGGDSVSELADTGGGDYHTQDVNLFWLDLRRDLARRTEAWLEAHRQ